MSEKKYKAKRSKLPWFLLILVCFLWYVDCATRPAAETPFIDRATNWVKELIGSKDSIVVEGDNHSQTNSTSQTTNNTTNNYTSGGVTIGKINSSTLSTNSKWKLTSTADKNGQTLHNQNNTIYVQFNSYGTISVLIVHPDGWTGTDTYYWNMVEDTLLVKHYINQGGYDSRPYTLRNSTLTIQYEHFCDNGEYVPATATFVLAD